MRKQFVLVLCLVACLAACNSGKGDGGGDTASGCSGHSCYITLTDSGEHLHADASVGMMTFALPSCAAGSIVPGPSYYFRSGEGSAILGFSLSPGFFDAGAAAITFWIDSDDSHNLNPGDWTWGTSTTVQTILCVGSLADLEGLLLTTFDWTAAGRKYTGGTRQWAGESKTYGAEPGALEFQLVPSDADGGHDG